jgi:hypothetical protein
VQSGEWRVGVECGKWCVESEEWKVGWKVEKVEWTNVVIDDEDGGKCKPNHHRRRHINKG